VTGTALWYPYRPHSEIRRRVLKKWHFVCCVCNNAQAIGDVELCGLLSAEGQSENYLTGDMQEALI